MSREHEKPILSPYFKRNASYRMHTTPHTRTLQVAGTKSQLQGNGPRASLRLPHAPPDQASGTSPLRR
ncbi:hypothetical protein VYU27_009035 [Nannochloropsis oceanica]